MKRVSGTVKVGAKDHVEDKFPHFRKEHMHKIRLQAAREIVNLFLMMPILETVPQE